MWGRKRQSAEESASADAHPAHLKEVVRQVRVELAEQTSVVVDLRDAELARLELLNETLDPLFNEIPPEIDIFDRGISQGDTPRLWIDMVAHVHMARDKRQYRFVQDTRFGRKVLAESPDVKEMFEAITRYIATRIVERERALATDAEPLANEQVRGSRSTWRQRWRMLRAFLFGLTMGFAALFAALWIVASRVQP